MKSLLVLVALAVLVESQRVSQIGQGDISNYLQDPNYVMKQINCVLDKHPCDRLGGQLKKAIPLVLNTRCAECTPNQAQNAQKLINFVQTRYPAAYQNILAKYMRAGRR